MEGFEESVPKSQTDQFKPQPDHKELGLGLRWPHSADHDLGLDPPPVPGDLVRQATDEEKENETVANQELKNQKPIIEELQNQLAIIEEHKNPQSIDEEHQNQLLINKEQQSVTQGLENLVLEEEEKVTEKVVNREVKADEAGNEADDKGSDSEVDSKGEDRNVNGSAKSEMGADAVYVNHDDDGGENEKEDDNGNEHDGEEVAVKKDGRNRRYHYPVRPGAEDCSYYMRTGTCKFGPNCKFNHPPRRKNQDAKERVKEKEEISEKPGQIECKYYLTSGGCKFGKSCRYSHGRGKTPVAPIVDLNFVGLPIRLGEKECPFYMRNGSCKYGSNCKFNHPDPTAAGGETPSGYGGGGSASLRGAPQTTASSWSSLRQPNEASSFVPVMFAPTQGVPTPNLGWTGYQNQASVYQAPERRLPTPPAFALDNPAEPNFYTYNKQQIPADEFPERPGQPECTYFVKTGDCKFKSGCKYHHPKSVNVKTAAYALSDKGLPLRPDQNVCSHYSRYGICKFGPACKFDHPVNLGQPTSAAVSGSDKPSIVGNLVPDDEAPNGWD